MSSEINWFGENKKKEKFSNIKSNSINFFELSPKKNISKKIALPINKSVSFLGLSSKKTKQHSKPINNSVNYLGLPPIKNNKITPSYFLKKESVKKKKLSKWGDADLDGSPNFFDCDPRNVSKDAKPLDALKRAGKAIKNKIFPKPYSLFEETREESKKSANIRKEFIEGNKKYIDKKREINMLREEYIKREKEKLKDKKLSKKIKKEMIFDINKELKKYNEVSEALKEYEEASSALKSEDSKAESREWKTDKAKTQGEKVKELLKHPGLKGSAEVAQYAIDVKVLAGKTPSLKESAKIAAIEQRMKKIGTTQQEGKISREILPKFGGQFGRVLSGAGVTKSGEYSGELKAKARRVSRMTAIASGAIFGDIAGGRIGGRYDSEPRPRGRPAGPSGEYKIGGRPVYEQEFQNYASKQNAMNRMLPSEQQSSTLNPEYVAYLKAKQAEEQGMQVVMTEEGMPMEGQVQTESEMPTTGTSMMQSGQQQELIRQKRAYTRAMPDEIKQAQEQAQQMDNVLRAPNFMKGELKATGGSILTPIGPSILEAPNSFKGEMRNVTKPNIDEGEIHLSERPQVNPFGSEYLDIELGSGKPVLRRRITEKFMDGRAL